jgi:RecA-family ATPase
VDEEPSGPDHSLVLDFARETKGVIIFDSLIDFHTGDEQSASDTRIYMKKFRHLAALGLGATVVVLQHAGKGEDGRTIAVQATSKQQWTQRSRSSATAQQTMWCAL